MGQIVATAVTWVLAIVVTFVLLKILDAVMGLRVSQEEEIQGLDFSQHGEEGAAFGLDNAINAGGRMVAPLVGSAVAVWFGLRSVFLVNGVIYLAAGVLAAVMLAGREQQSSPDAV